MNKILLTTIFSFGLFTTPVSLTAAQQLPENFKDFNTEFLQDRAQTFRILEQKRIDKSVLINILNKVKKYLEYTSRYYSYNRYLSECSLSSAMVLLQYNRNNRGSVYKLLEKNNLLSITPDKANTTIHISKILPGIKIKLNGDAIIADYKDIFYSPYKQAIDSEDDSTN